MSTFISSFSTDGGRRALDGFRAVVFATLAFACKGSSEPGALTEATSTKAPAAHSARAPADVGAASSKSPPAFAFPAPERLVAFGDVHGDLDAAKKALRLAGAIDDADRWVGGRLVLVQTGDQLDRGDSERKILDLLDRLASEAGVAGGAVHALNGNHETMNVTGDFRYVTPGGFAEFADVSFDIPGAVLARVPEEARGRAAAFFPGGPYARKLAKRNVVVAVGDTVFAHGGVLPEHVSYGIDRLNDETRRWMRGELSSPPPPITDDEGPVWTRRYSEHDAAPDCERLARALTSLGMRRMVVGHTVQPKGISSACDDRVWRIDVGMAAVYGGPVEALEIRGGAVRVLRAVEKSTP
jgi:hypothetical protein